MSRDLRGRLTLAFIGVAVAVLALTGLLVVVFARVTAIRVAQDELVDSGRALAELEASSPVDAERPAQLGRTLVALRPALRVEGASAVFVTGAGTVRPLEGLNPAGSVGTDGLPAGVDASDLDTDALLAGDIQEGRQGSTVFVAVPLDDVGRGTVVVVLSREVGRTAVGRLGVYLVVAAGLSIVVAVVGSALLARRLTRPLRAMEHTAQALAAGDLSARVGPVDGGEGELGTLAAALDGMAAQLEQARGGERAFLMSVSHDLRTPLTAIRGYAEAVGDGTIDDDETRARAAAIIASEARRLERLVGDLLDLARLDARTFSLHVERLDVSTVVADAAGALRPAADEAGLEVLVDAPPGLTVQADPQRLAQVVANLMENALKYATARVTLTASRGGPPTRPEVVIDVVDDGPGIDPADLPHVFDRLYTSRRVTGRKVGTGLGLAIARELVTAMGGRVEVGTGTSGGTRVSVRLPAA